MPDPVIILVVGSTGAGKTTHALATARAQGLLHFSIDEWMTTLFEADKPEPITFEWMMARIDRCENLIWRMAREAAQRGVGSILDLGFSRREHRARFADLARAAGIPLVMHYLDVPAEERWARVQARNADKGETYRLNVDRGMFDFVESIWEAPDEDEMAALNGVRIG